MSPVSKKIEWAVWGALGFIVLGVFGVYITSQFGGKPLPVLGEMISFSLTNQDSKTITLNDYDGRVWIADAIFTRCPGQCLIMSAHMKEIQDKLGPNSPIKLVSFTTDPEFDKPAVLKKYAEHFGAQENSWTFLTGSKSELHNAELEGLKLAVMDKPAAEREGANDLFIHSEKFVLIDKQGQIRGYFDGEEPDAPGMIVRAARRLARE